jgi:hypothetical protein
MRDAGSLASRRSSLAARNAVSISGGRTQAPAGREVLVADRRLSPGDGFGSRIAVLAFRQNENDRQCGEYQSGPGDVRGS